MLKTVKKIKHYNILKLCSKRGVHMTEQRKIIAKVINNSKDHPDVESIFLRSHKKNNKISLATVYRTVKLLEESKIIIKHDFKHGDEKARYEPVSNWEHNHLLDINSGAVIEFHNSGFENLSKKIAEKLGYKILGYKLELFGIKEACKKIKASK